MRTTVILLNKTIILFCIVFLSHTLVNAHSSGCHRWHSCPSDSGSYTCGDTGRCSYCPDNNYCKGGRPRLLAADEETKPELQAGAATEQETVTQAPEVITANNPNESSFMAGSEVTDLWNLEKRIGILFPNTNVTIIKETSNWYKVKIEGFIKKDQVTESKEETQPIAAEVIQNQIEPKLTKIKIPEKLWKNEYMRWLKIKDLNNGFIQIRYMCIKGQAGNHWKTSRGRKYRITCVDNEGIPIEILTETGGGCYIHVEGNPISTFEIPKTLSSACSTGASDFKFEWLD